MRESQDPSKEQTERESFKDHKTEKVLESKYNIKEIFETKNSKKLNVLFLQRINKNRLSNSKIKIVKAKRNDS
jgi:hypothetical protein